MMWLRFIWLVARMIMAGWWSDFCFWKMYHVNTRLKMWWWMHKHTDAEVKVKALDKEFDALEKQYNDVEDGK